MIKKASILIFSLLAVTSAIAGPSGGAFEITSYTIDGGGGRASGGEFTLTGTIGQPDASVVISTGSDFILSGGFWSRAERLDWIFGDGFEG